MPSKRLYEGGPLLGTFTPPPQIPLRPVEVSANTKRSRAFQESLLPKPKNPLTGKS
jgi:hypothetical protein